MSTVPRVSSAIPGEPAHFGSVLAHQPALASRFAQLYGAFWSSDVLSARVKELCRMRNARITECGFCRQVRFDKPLRAGLGEDVIADVTDDYPTSARLSEAEKAALRFTDALIFDPALFDDAAEAALRRHFTGPQIAELEVGVSLFLALAKVLITLGLEPEKMKRTELATPQAGETRTDISAQFEAFKAATRDRALIDPELLALGRARIADQHRGSPGSTIRSDKRERAIAVFADKLPFAHHAISDAEAAAVREALGEAGLVAFVLAAALCDAECRLDLVKRRKLAAA